MSLLSELLEAGLTFNTDGTFLQVAPAHAVTPALRKVILDNKPAIWEEVFEAEAQTAELIASVNHCCDARGDDDQNRDDLVRECKDLTLREVKDLIEHFNQEAARWLRATGQAP